MKIDLASNKNRIVFVLKVALVLGILLEISLAADFFLNITNSYDEFNRPENEAIVSSEFEEVKRNTGTLGLSKYGKDNELNDATIMIYASGTELNDEFIERSVINAQKIGSTKKVKVLLLFDRKQNLGSDEITDTRLYFITKNDEEEISHEIIDYLGKADVSKAQVLHDFVRFAQANFPARKSILILDGVGKGPGGLIFDESANSYLSAKDIEDVLSKVYFAGGTIVDTLVMNTSFAANVETFAALTPYVRHIIATPGYSDLGSLDYTRIIKETNDTVGKSATETSKRVLNAVASSHSCQYGDEFFLYDLGKMPNITNGLEILAAAYFKGDTSQTQIYYRNVIASSEQIYAGRDELPIYNLSSVLQSMEDSEHEQLGSAAEHLSSDIDKMILARGTDCGRVTPQKINIHLPTEVDHRLYLQLENTTYTRLFSLREMVKNLFFIDDLRPVDFPRIVNNDDHFSQTETLNQRYCYRGLLSGNKYLVKQRYLGVASDGEYRCDLKKSKSHDVVVRNRDEIYFAKYEETSRFKNEKDEEEVRGKRLVIVNNGVSDVALAVPVDYFEYAKYGRFIDDNSRIGYFFDEKKESSETILEASKENRAISFTEKKQQTEVIKAIGRSSNVDSYTYTYDIYEVKPDLKNVEVEINILTEEVTGEFANYSTNFKDKSRHTERIRPGKFRYNEYIYANRANYGNSLDYSGGSVDFGNDKKYYKDELVATDDNLNFWNAWFNEL